MAKSYSDVKSQFMQREYKNGATKSQANKHWHKSDAKRNSNPTLNPPEYEEEEDDGYYNEYNYPPSMSDDI